LGTFTVKREYIEGKEATERFEKAMKTLFRAPKPPKHKPKKRAKKGKD
jgi:hypothetical protein